MLKQISLYDELIIDNFAGKIETMTKLKMEMEV